MPQALLPDLSLAGCRRGSSITSITIHGEGIHRPASKPLTGRQEDMGEAKRVPQQPPSSALLVGVEAQDLSAHSLILLRSRWATSSPRISLPTASFILTPTSPLGFSVGEGQQGPRTADSHLIATLAGSGRLPPSADPTPKTVLGWHGGGADR
ncbi:hypothetical protein E2562_021453 [Oryza meyeriana var. granulata]|uniref:Uncharacterized protein n=1 Tax=Oryza meyeriana var. granulata TaxID=110450 RepID=A0A6G1C767_9ORYZ|nr:hypothetical protein E2562_021453 [Oryza meyeriana var. granulata]